MSAGGAVPIDGALKRTFAADLEAISASTSSDERAALLRFAAILAHWNTRIRLAGPRRIEALVREQLVDAVAIARAFEIVEPGECCDVGAGNGLPGLAVAILRPKQRFVLIEPVHKKTAFLRHAAHELGLDNVEVVTGRVDPNGAIDPEPRLRGETRPEIALSRATFQPLAWLRTARALVGAGGVVVLTAAGELPPEIAADPGSTEIGSWRYAIPATHAPRVIAARRFIEVAQPPGSV